jgi:pimeloyl-ACP methyl ester carboxylesterase
MALVVAAAAGGVIAGALLLLDVLQHVPYEYGGGRGHASAALGNKSAPPAGAQRVRLSRGEVLYRVDGASHGGRLVVLVHGFIGCHLDYERVAQHLSSAGRRRVLRMDNYGRGWSSLPAGLPAPCPELYAGQLAELLLVLGEHGAVDLVGYSMGGCIVSAFADKFGPSRVATLTVLAPAGLPAMRAGGISPLAQRLLASLAALPMVGRRLGVWLASRALHTSADSRRLGWRTDDKGLHEWYEAMYRARLANEPALPHAFITTVAVFPFAHMLEAFEGVARQGIPTLALWADQDEQIPIASAAELRAAYARAAGAGIFEDEVYTDRTHIFPIEEGVSLVGPRILAFYASVAKAEAGSAAKHKAAA